MQYAWCSVWHRTTTVHLVIFMRITSCRFSGILQLTAWLAAQWCGLVVMCYYVQHIVTITLKVTFIGNKEQHCHLPSLVDDFACVHSKNALLSHILSTLFSSTSVLFSCTPFGTQSSVINYNKESNCNLLYTSRNNGKLHHSYSSSPLKTDAFTSSAYCVPVLFP